MLREVEAGAWPADRLDHGPAGPEAAGGRFADGRVTLGTGRPLPPRPRPAHRATRAGSRLPHPEIFAVLQPGQDLLLDDGRIRLEVERCGPDFAETIVVNGGGLSDRKGVNVPNAVLPISAMTDEGPRRPQLRASSSASTGWRCRSCSGRRTSPSARKLIAGRAAILAKIEKPAAIERLDEIIELSDAVMVARGDLGVEMPPELVPGLQKRIIRKCRDLGKPVVVATQMLESMISSPAPTRAEASDVATAVYDGADAVMLSAESASGDYPVEAVTIMDRIIASVEHDDLYRFYLDAYQAQARAHLAPTRSRWRRIRSRTPCSSAVIVTYTTSGATALRASRERPDRPILGLITRMIDRPQAGARLGRPRGAHRRCPGPRRDGGQGAPVRPRAKASPTPGESIVITAGLPFGTPGATNLLRVAWVT